MISHLEFVQDPSCYAKRGDEYVVHIPFGLASKEALLTFLREKLQFPPYCGANWDALLDCLRDLSWLKPRRVVLLHEDVPRLQEDDLRNYLGVLKSAIGDWKVDEEHELHGVFPEWNRSSVVRWMHDG